MSDSTRPHPRIERYEVPGRRVPLPVGTLYLADRFKASQTVDLVVHFHGAPWLVEHHARAVARNSVIVTVQMGAGSRVYSDGFADPAVFARLLEESAGRTSELTGHPVSFRSVTLSAFSAGYGAVRSILQHPPHYARIDAVLLADSLHASYAGPVAPSRATDLPIDESGLEPFVRFARDAVAGRKRFWLTHSEVFPGTFASTTETADVLLRHAAVPRRRVLRNGPIGMQQLSEGRKGQLTVSGFAGNSAPDHLDHLYALGELLWK
jgi:hypothetical protein